MESAGERGDSVYLRGFGDYERSSLKLTAAAQSGVGHIAYRTHSPEALARRVAAFEATGVEGEWLAGDLGHGARTASSIPTATASSCSTSPSGMSRPPSCGRR